MLQPEANSNLLEKDEGDLSSVWHWIKSKTSRVN